MFQSISGISFDTYNDNPSLYESVLKQTIADCLNGINPDDITNLVVTEASSSRRLVAKSLSMMVPLQLRGESTGVHHQHRRHLQADAIRTRYVIRSSNSTLTYETLSTQLASAVSTGAFDTILSENAEDAGASELVGCQSSEVSTAPIHRSSDGRSSDGGLSGGAIAGIVIGCLVGVGLIITGVVLWISRRSKKVAVEEDPRMMMVGVENMHEAEDPRMLELENVQVAEDQRM